MTNKLSEKNLYFYYKLLVAKTRIKYKLSHGERWVLEVKTDNRGYEPISRYLSLTEMYEVLLSMVNNIDILNNKYLRIAKLNKQEQKFVDENIHDENIIKVVEE